MTERLPAPEFKCYTAVNQKLLTEGIVLRMHTEFEPTNLGKF